MYIIMMGFFLYKECLLFRFLLVKERELMLRATAGSGISVRDTWLGKVQPHPVEDTCISMATGACSTHYLNSKVDLWENLPINQVKQY